MKRMMYKKKAQDKENSLNEESEDIDSDTEEEEDPPTYRTRRRQTKRDRFAEQIEDIVQEQHRDDETVEEPQKKIQPRQPSEEEATEESASDTRARGRASIPPASRSRAAEQ
eukprot:5602521-Prorocentrum_lima.AAC.1